MIYPTLVTIHSVFRWLVVILLLAAVVNALVRRLENKEFASADYRLSLFAMVSTHLQLLLGVVLYFLSPMVVFSGTSMGSDLLRFYLLEHPLMMILGIVLITLGFIRMKKAAGHAGRFMRIFWFYLAGILLMLAGIPWPFRGWGNGWI